MTNKGMNGLGSIITTIKDRYKLLPWYLKVAVLILTFLLLFRYILLISLIFLTYKLVKKSDWSTRKKTALTLILWLILLPFAWVWLEVFSSDLTRGTTSKSTELIETPKNITEESTQSTKVNEASPSENTQIEEESLINTEPIETKKYLVVKIIDGDTIEIEGGQHIRYIGIDTPETVNPNSPVECFGKEASNKNKELVEGKMVKLEKDVSETDKYGRLLRYVWVGDVFVNDYLVKEGYANSSSYSPDIKYQNQFLASESRAREGNKGLWGSCNSETVQPTPAATVSPTTSAPKPTKTSCKYSCSGPDRDCSDFSTHSEAQSFFSCCGFTATNDPMRLDGTGVDDGIACESLP